MLVILMMALDIVDLALVAAAGALLCVITGCIGEKEAYQAIDWSTIFLFAGALSLANAMASTGAGSILADLCIRALGGSPSPYMLFTVLFLVCGLLTQFMSNTASGGAALPHRPGNCGCAGRFSADRRARAGLFCLCCLLHAGGNAAQYPHLRTGQSEFYGLRENGRTALLADLSAGTADQFPCAGPSFCKSGTTGRTRRTCIKAKRRLPWPRAISFMLY